MKTKKLLFFVLLLALTQFSFGQSTGFVCNSPNEPYIDQVTRTSANLNWYAGRESSWQIEVGVVGFTPGTGQFLKRELVNGESFSQNTFVIRGLKSNYRYEVYIKSLCSCGTTSKYLGPISINTLNSGIAP